MGTPNGLREPVWWGLRGCGGGEESFLWVRGVEAGRAGTGPEADPVRLDVCIGIIELEKFVRGGWPGGEKEKGCVTVGD